MKKELSLMLAALMLASLLCSCAGTRTDAIAANVRVTSSDASDAAAWITERLGEIPDRLVLGTDASAYGIDVSALETDGYIIRDLGGEVALFARTADGLDRAARRYAKAAESGAKIGDVTYHEGYRVKQIEIAGRDISEYTVYCADDARLISAAKELSARIAEANGVSLTVSTDEPRAPYIALCYVHDESLSTVGYRWSVTEDGLTVECSDGYSAASPGCAVKRFLEKALDWFGLSYGIEELTPSDFIEIAVGESGGETNAFKYVYPYGDNYSVGDDRRFGLAVPYSIPHCCHGLSGNCFAGELSVTGDWGTDQPCYLDDEFYELSVTDVSAYIERHLAAGYVIGENFFFVDIAAGDNDNWCQCKNCRKMFKNEGYTESGAVVTWANKLTETLSEDYPGLAYGIFAYAGSNKPPKTVVPNEHVYITFCYDMSCDVHTHSGADCTGDALFYTSGPQDHRTVTLAKYLEDWTLLTDNMYIWFYGMELSLHSASYVDIIVDDMRYYASLGVCGLF